MLSVRFIVMARVEYMALTNGHAEVGKRLLHSKCDESVQMIESIGLIAYCVSRYEKIEVVKMVIDAKGDVKRH